MNQYKLIHGECLEEMKKMESNSVTTIITDPPYGLSFMGKKWDYEVPSIEIWQECLRVLKPGGTALIFAGSRTQHRMAVNVEDAGFILKDVLMWIFGSGFPKSHNIAKQLEKQSGKQGKIIGEKKLWGHNAGSGAGSFSKNQYEGQTGITRQEPIRELVSEEAQLWGGWHSHALKPAYEPIIMAMKPNNHSYAKNALEHGVAGLWIDGARVPTDEVITNHSRGAESAISKGIYGNSRAQKTHQTKEQQKGRFPANVILDEDYIDVLYLTETENQDTIKAIKEFYYGYKLPLLSKRIKCSSIKTEGRERKILQQEMLSSMDEQKFEGRKSSNVRKKTQQRISSKNERIEEENSIEGKKPSNLQGAMDESRLSLSESIIPEQETKRNSRTNDGQKQKRNSRTQINNGNAPEQAVEKIGDYSPQKRNQTRQQNREFRNDEQLNSQERTQRDIERVANIESGKRKIEILECDIPDIWKKYFSPTGYCIRNPSCAAALLDQQTGKRKSGGSVSGNEPSAVTNGIYGEFNNRVSFDGYKDSGGASRFFMKCEQDNFSFCVLCGSQTHDIMKETQEGELSCENANIANRNLVQTEKNKDFVQNPVQQNSIQKKEDSKESESKFVQPANQNSMLTHQITKNIAQNSVTQNLKHKAALFVRSVESLCEKCTIDIVQKSVAIQTDNMESQAMRDFITDYKKCILIQSLAQYAEKWESIDTTPTTKSLSKLFGSANLAITKCINETTKSAPKRFSYHPKASKKEKNAGLEEFEAKFQAGAEFRPSYMERAKQGESGTPHGRFSPTKNFHPTVKPIALMEYLCKLTMTPTKGIVLDPFMGSGSTGVGSIKTGRYFIGIEMNQEYIQIADARILHAIEEKKSEQPKLF